MTKEEILKRAIEKAKENGFVLDHSGWGYHYIIFSHDFAKAFWGEEPKQYVPDEKTLTKKDSNWKYHLQMMVLEEDPIKYLEKFL